MKPQDIIFIIILLGLLYKRSPKYFVVAGLSFLLLSMPLFHLQIFFTAERFVWYAFGLVLVGVLFFTTKNK